MNDSSTARTLIVALAVLLAGMLIGRGVERFRIADRSVTVKGVAEREVKADVGLWPLSFVAASDDLGVAQRKVQSDRRAVLAFLARHGIDSTATELIELRVTDTSANPYGGRNPGASRYVVRMVRTHDVDRLRDVSQRADQLLNAGVVIAAGGEYGPSGPTYLFTKLNDFKPTMIAEATKNAREAAQQFARESRARVGPMRRASQGIFEILPRNPAPGVAQEGQIAKTLRVVSTVEYLLN
jgi:hypothetical protein